jgi:cobalt-zinc-cadmium resistance protein CzcA
LFENEILKDSKTIIDAANAQFKNGDINYMQWVFNINQSFDIKIKYVESIKKLNQSIIQLHYFTTNK